MLVSFSAGSFTLLQRMLLLVRMPIYIYISQSPSVDVLYGLEIEIHAA